MSHEEGGDKPQGPDRRESIVATVGEDAILYLQLMNFEDGERVEVMVTPANARSSVATNEADIYADGFAAGLEAAAVEVSGHWNVTGLRCDQKEQAERSAAVIRRLPIARSSRSARLEQVGWARLGTANGKRYVQGVRYLDDGQNDYYAHAIYVHGGYVQEGP